MRDWEHAGMPLKCENCGQRSSGFFSTLPEPAFSALESIKLRRQYPRGATIFMQGQAPKGAYVICSGRAKLFAGSEDGRTIILRFSDPGEMLGLSALFIRSPYEESALAVEDACVSFLGRRELLAVLEAYPEAALAALRQVSANYQQAQQQLCALGLSTSVSDKLARLLLQWCNSSSTADEVRIRRGHSHSDIAEMIGASRETVTRLLGSFRDQGLVRFSKAELVIPDPARLRSAIGAHRRNGYGNGNGKL